MSFICNWLKLGFTKCYLTLELDGLPLYHSLSIGIASVNSIANNQNPFDLAVLGILFFR